MLDNFIHRRMRTPYTLHVERLRWPKRATATIVCIHGIGSSTAMWKQFAEDMPSDVRVVAVDLLGFGRSPKPAWATYDAHTQAKAVIKTLVLNRISPGSIFVGHSLGSLVAVEVARRVPWYPTKLYLISPPIYKPSRNKIVATQREDVLRGVYKILQRYPKNTERGLMLAKKYYVKKTGMTVTHGTNIATYLSSLESSIINQDTINHIDRVRAPITIISGSRDPLVIGRNLTKLAKSSEGIEHLAVKKAGHNIVGNMRQAVSKAVLNSLGDIGI